MPIIITADISEKEILLEAINLDTSHYLMKPFNDSALLEAIEFAAKKLMHYTSNIIIYDLKNDFSYDSINKSIYSLNESVQLTKKEYSLLELLLENKGQYLSYDVIENYVWKEKTMSIDALRTLIRNLRKKTYSNLIVNHSSLGYKISWCPSYYYI